MDGWSRESPIREPLSFICFLPLLSHFFIVCLDKSKVNVFIM